MSRSSFFTSNWKSVRGWVTYHNLLSYNDYCKSTWKSFPKNLLLFLLISITSNYFKSSSHSVLSRLTNDNATVYEIADLVLEPITRYVHVVYALLPRVHCVNNIVIYDNILVAEFGISYTKSVNWEKPRWLLRGALPVIYDEHIMRFLPSTPLKGQQQRLRVHR